MPPLCFLLLYHVCDKIAKFNLLNETVNLYFLKFLSMAYFVSCIITDSKEAVSSFSYTPKEKLSPLYSA